MLRDLKLPEGIRRLQRLEQLLEEHADKLEARERADYTAPPVVGFDLDFWVDDCGTAACACGLMAMQPEAQRQGLSLERKLLTYSLPVQVPGTDGWKTVTFHGIEAAAEYFGIDVEDARYLFTTEAYARFRSVRGPRGCRLVASRVRQFVSERVMAL